MVDQVIVDYERMIGSFNYSVAGTSYSLAVNMNSAGSGFGASAGLGTTLGGKARSGSINMGAGTNTPDPNDTNGWFMDPTPDESSEFAGTIVNAFSADAQAGSPAAGKGDFFTVVAAEMTHCMGLYGSALPGWANLTTNTGVADLAEAGSGNTSGSRGTYWVFRGPSIEHLLTSNNGGSGGSSFGSAVHAAGPNASNQPLVFDGDTYIGAQDQGNAVYETGRRYLMNDTFALMFKDAYNYATVNPAQFGTFYSNRDSSTKVVTVRGGDFAAGQSNSNDFISITRSGDTIFVSVDAGKDIPGTGALSGPGDLPAFVTQYDISQVSSINILAGAGNDSITIGADLGVTVTVDASTGNDTLTIVGTADSDTISVNGPSASAGSTTISAIIGIETIRIDGGGGADTINTNETVPGVDVGIIGSAGSAASTVAINSDGVGLAVVSFIGLRMLESSRSTTVARLVASMH